MRWSTYWHPSKFMLFFVLHRGKNTIFHLLPLLTVFFDSWECWPNFQADMLSSSFFTACGNCISPEKESWHHPAHHESFKNSYIPTSIWIITSEMLNGDVNVMYHIRKVLIKFSTNQTREGKTNSTENTDFKVVKIFTREELGVGFSLVPTTLCVY